MHDRIAACRLTTLVYGTAHPIATEVVDQVGVLAVALPSGVLIEAGAHASLPRWDRSERRWRGLHLATAVGVAAAAARITDSLLQARRSRRRTPAAHRRASPTPQRLRMRTRVLYGGGASFYDR